MIKQILNREEAFKFLKIFIFLFFVVFIVVNLGTIKRMFNYQLVYSDEEKKEILQEAREEEEIVVFIQKPNSIEIPKINIEAPLIFIASTEQGDFQEALDRGVVNYPGSALLGEPGQTIFLGHSAPPGWPKINYDWVFSEINDLLLGDEIFIYFNGQRYDYLVKEKIFLEKGEELPAEDISEGKNTLILLSCWPPGADRRRIAVIAEGLLTNSGN
jgi:LPXTG-site transpeptidase (sortase) family protein